MQRDAFSKSRVIPFRDSYNVEAERENFAHRFLALPSGLRTLMLVLKLMPIQQPSSC